NHLLPTSFKLPPYKLTMRLRFLAQLSCVLQPMPCQSRSICVLSAISTPLFSVAPTFCKMLGRPLIPDSCLFKSSSLVAARYTSTDPDTLPCPAVNSSPTSVCVVCSYESLGSTKPPGRSPPSRSIVHPDPSWGTTTQPA